MGYSWVRGALEFSVLSLLYLQLVKIKSLKLYQSNGNIHSTITFICAELQNSHFLNTVSENICQTNSQELVAKNNDSNSNNQLNVLFFNLFII